MDEYFNDILGKVKSNPKFEVDEKAHTIVVKEITSGLEPREWQIVIDLVQRYEWEVKFPSIEK